MAALLDSASAGATGVREDSADRNDGRTENWTLDIAEEQGPEFPSHVPSPRIRTDAEVQHIERGYQYDRERNVGEFGQTRTIVEAAETDSTNGDTIRLRSEVARDLRNRMDGLIPLAGQIAFAAHLQLLKRDLSRCHDLLADHPSETSFLSIVTLIESAVSQRKWKDYTAEQLRLIREAVDVGYRQPHVTFDDYERIRRQFSQTDIDTHPRIDLDIFSLNEITDDEVE